jgi:RHS repeat-associated protein
VYDVRGLLLAETRGEPTSGSPTWSFTWDAIGNRETANDPNGTATTFSYDAAGRLTGRAIRKGPGVGGAEATSFNLDVLGRPVADSATAGASRVERTRRYDSLGRALEETLRIGAGPERRVRRSFDAADNPVELTYPSGRKVAQSFDPLNRLAEIRSAAGDLLARYEDLGSRQLRRALGNGLTEEREYDASGWLSHLAVGPSSNPNGTFSVTYGRNGRSLKTDVGREDLGKRHHYDYDAASRIVREQLGLAEPAPPPPSLPEVETFLTLDGLLNIVTEERTEAGTQVTTTSTTNSRNQVTRWGSDPVVYDANGNVVSFRSRTFRYDADNRLVSATLPGGGTYEVLRDANGRKVRETLTSAGVSQAVDVVQDGDRTLETFAANEGVPLESLVYGRGIDEVVRADLDPDGDGFATVVYPVQDELGNVVYLTDADGAVLERYHYETYGRFRVFAPDGAPRSTSSLGWNRLFQGREYVPALDAYDFRNRLLLPALGRFAQEDPLGYVDSLNLYQAFGGGWVNATDPWGLRAATRADEAQRAAILAAIEANRREAVKGGLHGSAMEDYEEAARFTLSNFDAAIEAAGTSDPVGITDNKLFGGANGGGTYGYEFGVLPRGGGAGDIAGMTIDGALQDSAVVIARIPEFLPIVPGAKSARARRTVKGPARREVPRERYTRELPPGERRSADENALAREYYRNHRDKAIELYEKETGLQWPRDPQTGKPLWAEHPRSLKEGGNPLRVEPGSGADPNAPHSVPGPDGLTDHQRWGALGTPAREARRRGN